MQNWQKPKSDQRAAPDLSMTELSLQYLLSQPAVASVITGASSLAERKLFVAEARRLSDQEIKALQYHTKRDVYEAHRS
ncbi:aldo/keto reductase [Bacillus velezensis]|nr:aldo/keto reductase [Bacillus velezensis]